MYETLGKRLFDITASAAGLVFCLPLLLLCAAAVVIDSGPPVFFRQERMGEKGKRFMLIKFRTMCPDRAREQLLFEPGKRHRVTRAGAVLRKLKLDELPQLLNVLKGEMSFVGPRPEVPKYRHCYAGRYAAVLTVRPGITDTASIKYRNEEELLALSREPERLYRETILPDKLAMNLAYAVRKITLRDDLSVILRTLTRLVRQP